jgi:hypothetical protein
MAKRSPKGGPGLKVIPPASPPRSESRPAGFALPSIRPARFGQPHGPESPRRGRTATGHRSDRGPSGAPPQGGLAPPGSFPGRDGHPWPRSPSRDLQVPCGGHPTPEMRWCANAEKRFSARDDRRRPYGAILPGAGTVQAGYFRWAALRSKPFPMKGLAPAGHEPQ